MTTGRLDQPDNQTGDVLVNQSTKRSILAVVVGVVAIVVVTTVVDVVLHRAGVFPPMNVPLDDRLSLIASSYRLVIGVAGAWLTARLAPAQPMKHALILGVVGTLLGTLGVLATWGKGMGPAWYPISLAVLAIPECWAGGKLYQLTQRRPDADGGRG
jgi:hypothetical protein